MCIGPPLVLSMYLCFPFICRSVGLFMALASVLALMEKGKFVGLGAFCRAVFYTCQPSFKRVTTTLAWAFLYIFDLFPCLHWPTFVFLSFLSYLSARMSNQRTPEEVWSHWSHAGPKSIKFYVVQFRSCDGYYSRSPKDREAHMELICCASTKI